MFQDITIITEIVYNSGSVMDRHFVKVNMKFLKIIYQIEQNSEFLYQYFD